MSLVWESELEEMEDDDFDDNGVPTYDTSSQIPEESVVENETRTKSVKDCSEGDTEDCLLLKEEEDDNGIDWSFKCEDGGNATDLLSSNQKKHEDAGGATQDFREQDSTGRLDERQSAATSDGKYVSLGVEGELDVCCEVGQDNSSQDYTIDGFADAVNCDDPEKALSSSQEDLEENVEGSCWPSSDETDIGKCVKGSEKTLNDERNPTQKTLKTESSLVDSDKTEAKTYEKPIDEYKQIDFFDKGTGVPTSILGIEDTPSSEGDEFTALSDGGADEFDPGPSRDGKNGSFHLTHQGGNVRKKTRQLEKGSLDVFDFGPSEQEDNHSPKSKKTSSVSTKLHVVTIIALILRFDFMQGATALTVIPEDVLASSGSIARLRCSTDYPSPVYWGRKLFGSDEQETIYYGKLGMTRIAGDRFSVEEDSTSGRYDLIIRNVHLEDAGIYTCIDEAGFGDGYSGELVVYEHFTCEMPVPGNGFMGENIFDIPEDQVVPTCSLSFRGNQVPRFQWTWGKKTYLVAPKVINGSTVTSSEKFRATHDMNGASLTCLPILSATATSLDDSPRWMSDSVTVRYVHVMFGSVEMCQSSAMIPVCNPNCTYIPQQTSDNKCQCLAVYNDQGRTYNSIFNEQSCEMLVWPNINVVVVVVAIVASFAIVTGIIFVIHRMKDSRSNETPGKLKQTNNRPAVDASYANVNEIQALVITVQSEASRPDRPLSIE